MTTASIPCNHCGALLQVPATVNFVTCNHCGTRLAVKRTADATYTEAAGDQALQSVADHLGAITQQNELARIDREWQIEREQYMVADRYGRRQVPSAGMSVIGGIVVVGFGIFWTIFAFSITSHFPADFGGGIAKIFPFFGFLFILGGAAFSVYSYSKAQQYERAFQAYQRRRQAFLHGQPRPERSPDRPDWPPPGTSSENVRE